MLSLDEEGRLDPRDFGIAARPFVLEDPEDFHRKNRLILIVASLLVFSISVFHAA